MGIIKVKNKKGTALKTPEFHDSWLEFHRDKNDYDIDFCVNDGLHVIGVGKVSKEYIAPLCKKCNSQSSNVHFKVDEDFLVPVVND